MTKPVRLFAPRLMAFVCAACTLSACDAQGPQPRGGVPMSPSGRTPTAAAETPTLGGPGLSMAASDELVSDIRVEGNRTISPEKITAQMSTRIGRPFDPEALSRDVRKLASMPWFVSVRPFSKHTPQGRVVILKIVERTTVRYVEYLGNAKLKDKRLAKETGLAVGVAVDPYAVEDGRTKILAAYADNGFVNAQVSILEGDKAADKGVIYVINEGVKQKIWTVKFEGNDSKFASDRRLKTRVQSKPGMLKLFGGKLNREMLDADVRKLTEYYRAFGFFQARVGRTLEFNNSGEWVTVRFVIHEGPRYQVRSVRFLGNEKFGADSLAMGVKMPKGEPFEQAKMNADVQWLKEVYGSQGYVFADVKAEPIFLEEPGKIDLVYNIEEGKRWRVGRIFVHVGGENPHTRIQTALNRLSLRPGEIMDIRELRASERRLQASQLFLTDPARGISPKITYRIPELGDTDFTASAGDAIRGQGEESGSWVYEQLRRAGFSIYRAFHREDRFQPDLTAPPMDLHMYLDQVPPQHSEAKAPSLRHTVRKPPVNERAWHSSGRPIHSNYANLNLPAAQTVRGQSPTSPPPSNYGGSYPGATSPDTARPAGYTRPIQPGQPPQGNVQPAQYGAPGRGAYPPYSNISPPAITGQPPNSPGTGPIAPSVQPDPFLFPNQPFADPAVDLYVSTQEAQTGRFMVGVGVNSDAGVVGQILIDERNFDWRRVPTSWQDVYNGTAFRGGGQGFRIEAAPGTQVQRYQVSFTNPYVFDTPISMSLGGSFYDRRYDFWDEQRLGGRISYGYQWTENDLSARLTYRGENVNIHDAVLTEVPELTETIGDNSLHGFGVVIANDTRNNPFLATEGHYVELQLEQVVGTFNYPRAIVDARKYFLLNERPDHSGRHVVVAQTRVGFTGKNTPVYDRFFAGGYATMRGFDYRRAGPNAGGDFMFLNTLEYMFPITADDMINGVVFCDFGTVEDRVKIDTWRVAPGVGLRIQVPAMGPAPIALDFAWPVSRGLTDELQVFTFNVGWMR